MDEYFKILSYHQEQEIVYSQSDFHHPPAYAEAASRRQVRPKKTGAHSRHACLPVGREHTERTVLMVNREVPIFHELSNLFETEAFCLSAPPRQTKNSLLRDLCGECRQFFGVLNK